MARAGMASIITDLRRMGAAGTADISVAGVDYFSDDQLQDVLDGQRREISEVLTPSDAMRYYFETRPVERAATAGAFQVLDAAGSAVGTAEYSVNYPAREITFVDDQHGAQFTLKARTFDMPAAAAEVWESKAAAWAAEFDVTTDNHNVKRSQKIKHAQMMAAQYHLESEKAAELAQGQGFVRMTRVDTY